jgi:hypothetical protein
VIVSLISAGNNVWTGGTQATVGAVLRYRYLRALPSLVEEVTPGRDPVPFRLLVVGGDNVSVDDAVAAWGDTPFAGDVGGIAGTVRNSNTGQGVEGVIVSAGGKLTLTAWDGSYAFYDLPVGNQRVTLLAPDGSLRPTQNVTSVAAGQMSALDFATPDPNQVHVTFLVRLPNGTDANAAVRLAGNVAQLGDTFALDADGSAIAAGREPPLVPLADGRWATSLVLYEGTVLNYKFTLGDGVTNGELDSAGARRLRQLVVPLTDWTVEGSVASWHTGPSAPVTFHVTTPAGTPANDLISMQFRTGAWQPPVPMWRVGVTEWKFVLYNPTETSGSVFYRYCRNYACGSADDVATAGSNAPGRFFTFALLPQTFSENVTGWQWLADYVPAAGVLPNINVHFGFAAGVDFADEWNPNQQPFFGETMRNVQATGANWVSLMPRAKAVHMNPPYFADDLALSAPQADWINLVGLVHSAGLNVVLHPVTCHYTPYGACEYWDGVAYTTAFWNAWFAAYEKALLTEADFAAHAGADVLVVGDFKLRPSFPGEPEAPPDADGRWRALINNVRAHYSGRLAFELLMGQTVWPNPPPFLDAVDVIRFFWWSPLSSGNTPGVNDMAGAAGALMDAHLLPVQQRFNKTIQISAAYYSADGAATQCLKRDDGQCYAYETFNPGSAEAARYALDLQEQADIYNALLYAVNDRNWVMGFSAFGYNPVAVLRDKSISVRGKPAEAILSAWFPKLQGK